MSSGESQSSPPSLWLPRYLPEDFVAASTDQVAVVVHGVACYPTGFAFTLETLSRHAYAADVVFPEEDAGGPEHDELFCLMHGSDPPPEALRFAIAYSDGRRATTLDRGGDDGGLRLEPQGSIGNGVRWSHSMWAAPLPPPGPVRLSCRWPGFGIEETTTTLDGASFIEAGEAARQIL